MKILIGRDELFEGIQKVFSVIPQKPTLPILTNFLFKASSGQLSISGTDMDIMVTTSIECTVEKEGEIAVNAKRFLNVIRELPEGSVDISVDGERVTINFEHGQSSIMGMSTTDFPALKDDLEGVSVILSSSDFVKMVEKTSFSVALDRTRVALTGVYWKVSSDKMLMVATDGHRLSLLDKKISIDTETQFY